MLKSAVKAALIKLLRTDFVRQELEELIQNRVRPSGRVPFGLGESFQHDIALRSLSSNSTIVVTSRFRSGSTLLWRCFREVQDITAYYEPLNPRKWFDPSARGEHVDATHRGVKDYWLEYQSLHQVGDVPWSDDWHSKDFYLPPSVPLFSLQRYLTLLMESSPSRAVLQFNRMDFRLQWVRTFFPDCWLLHLYRNPRDQWVSTFLKGQPVGTEAQMSDFLPYDEFYLTQWCRDLRRWMPIFDEVNDWHPYQVSYLISRLSALVGEEYSDVSISYEQLVTKPRETLEHVANVVLCSELPDVDAAGTIDAKSVGRWRTYAEESWFVDKEVAVDRVLQSLSLFPASSHSQVV